MRGNISRFCAIDTEGGWRGTGEYGVKWEMGVDLLRTKLVLQSGTVYNSIGHIKRRREEKDEEVYESKGVVDVFRL